MIYHIALGMSDDAPVVEHEAPSGSLHIGDEIQVDGVMWLIYQLAPFTPGREVDFIAALSAPPVAMMLDGEPVEWYRSELAQLRPEVARLTDTRGDPAVEALAIIEAILERDEAPRELSDEAIGILVAALHAIEVSDGLSDRLRAVYNALRDYLARKEPA